MTPFGHDSKLPPSFFQEERNPNGQLPSTIADDESQQRSHFRRRLLIWLFVLTLVSMMWSGVTAWSPMVIIFDAVRFGSLSVVRRVILDNALVGTLFAVSLLAILTAHELGHYAMTRWYGIASTPPIFVPFPISPIGTCGAVIAMEGSRADRKQIFDIGIAGPLAGLVVLVPILIAGLLTDYAPGYVPAASVEFGQPLLVRWMADWLQPDLLKSASTIANTQLNPFLMAAWAGLLVTGLNMMPMSQLDGGHVAFGLLGKKSVYIAYTAFFASGSYMVATSQSSFAIMLGLVFLLGLKHPPSRDDTQQLGLARTILGWASLLLPILCIPATPFRLLS